jgi:hypothetical protein
MAVLSNSKTRPVRLESGELRKRVYGMAGYTNFAGGNAAHTIYKGSVVVIDVSDTDGYCRACPLSSSTALAAGDIFCGIAAYEESVAAADLADGSKEISVYINGTWGFAVGSLAITDIGAPAYASDDDTITTTSTNNMWVGTIVDVDATYVWVDISQAAGQLNSAT